MVPVGHIPDQIRAIRLGNSCLFQYSRLRLSPATIQNGAALKNKSATPAPTSPCLLSTSHLAKKGLKHVLSICCKHKGCKHYQYEPWSKLLIYSLVVLFITILYERYIPVTRGFDPGSYAWSCAFHLLWSRRRLLARLWYMAPNFPGHVVLKAPPFPKGPSTGI